MLLKRWFLHALTAAAILGGLALAPRAEAGTYTVPFCDQSSSGSATSGWTHSTTLGASPYFWADDNCRDRQVYRRYELGYVPAGASDDWTFDAPEGTYLSQVYMKHDSLPRTSGSMNAIYSWQQDGTRTLTAAARAGGSLGNATYYFPLSGSKVIKLQNSLLCQPGANCPGTDANGNYGAEEYWHGAVVSLVDPSLPVFASVDGEGWKAEPVDGQDAIAWSASDIGAGVKEARFYVDNVLQTTLAGSCVNERPVPCGGSANGTFTLDTTRLSEGTHNLELHVVDGSLNEQMKQLAITVRRPPKPTSPSSGGAPVAISDPAASGGAPATGDQLHGSQGSWTGDGLTFTYQWMRCDAAGANCAAIPGATGLNYTVGSDDVGHRLQFCVTATNSGGSATSCSAPTAVVLASHPGSGGGATPVSADPVERPGDPVRTVPAAQPTAGSVGRGAANGSPAWDRVVLTALANNRVSTMKVKYGRRVPIGGRLVGPSGVPIAGAVLEIQTRTALPNASVAGGGHVVTGSDGRFRYVAPAGPSRTVRFAYRSHTEDTSFADTTDVNLLVSAGVTIKATPTRVRNRHATVFTGRLLGKPISKRGVVIDLQVFFRNKWRTFGAPRTNRAGRYKFSYRFMAGAATWKFRARVRRESSYPYLEGYSARTVKVRVTN